MCQVSIVVSQGLNTFNNLISASRFFVHIKKESSISHTVANLLSPVLPLFHKLPVVEIIGLSGPSVKEKSSLL